GAGLAGVDDGGPQAARGRAPGDRQPDRPTAGDGDIELCVRVGDAVPPYAGVTRIRFDGRRRGGALSARAGLP
ncbi:MAG: hypothetical protein QOK21_1089, partial [Solirubrobacteraceae bacterium]|nr:hypothetical protein [Solirubrobacteraceae bacterium]